jgi:hypothetical protein
MADVVHRQYIRNPDIPLSCCAPWDREPKLLTEDPKQVTCKECLKCMGK